MVKLFTSAGRALARTRDAGMARYFRLRAGARDLLTRREEGASLIEYALLCVFIAIACIVGMTFLGGKINEEFSKIGNTLT